MSELVVVGSIAFDSVETPFGKREKVLGGSANYFSLSSSFFAKTHMVGVVGKDFPTEHLKVLNERGIDTEGVQVQEGQTFHWAGYYGEDLNEAHTLATQLNVFENFSPQLPVSYRNCETVFLANIDPVLQLEVLEQVQNPSLIACDTMNFWIHSKRADLLKVLGKVDIFLSNEQELRDLSEERNILKAAEWVREKGPKVVVCKLGEYGSIMFFEDKKFWAPAYPLKSIFDPTGAGDTFAGGMIGYLAQKGGKITSENLKNAAVLGAVMASYNVQDFSCERLLTLTSKEIQERYQEIYQMTSFEPSQLQFCL